MHRRAHPHAHCPTLHTQGLAGNTAKAALGSSGSAAGCTLRDLCADDKAKVAKLIKQVVDLGNENQKLKEQQGSDQQQQQHPEEVSSAACNSKVAGMRCWRD